MLGRPLVAGGVLLAMCGSALAQPTLDLTLTSSLSQTVDPGSYTVTVENRLPQARYAIVIVRERIPIQAISLEGVGRLGSLERLLPERSPTACDQLVAAVKALNDASTESQVPGRRAAVEAVLAQQTCSDAAALSDAKLATAATRQVLPAVTLREGQRVTVTVTRTPAQAAAVTWTLTLSTEPRGEWLTSFGVSFAADGDERFNTEAAGDGRFQIRREADHWSLKPVPSVFFSWLSSKQRDGNWAFSPTAGFGLDSSSLTVMGGMSVIYNSNLSFIVGGAITSQRVLHGRYQPDQFVDENLSQDQLHRTVYRPAAIFSLALRFSRNPFARDTPADTPAAPETPAPPAGPVSATAGDAPAGRTPAIMPPAVPGGSGEPTLEVARDSDIKLRFDARGALREPAALPALLERAKNATDIFIVSHGWWNNESTADCFYRRIIGGIARTTPGYLTPERYRPLFVTVYWPSALFPMEPSDCTLDPRIESSATPAISFTFERVREWAANAYPDAPLRAEFDGEVRRVAALLEQERTSSLANAEAEELAALLMRWRDASGPSPLSGEAGEPVLFTGSPQQVAQRWRDRPADPRTAELSLPGLPSPRGWLNFGNAFTFWTMKERAGVVGSRGVYEVLRALQPLRDKRIKIHLIGHSFGGKLVSASLTGTSGPGNRVDSLIILQGAFSHFAFANREDIGRAGVAVDRDGLYRGILASSLVTGPVVVTHSSADTPNRLLYPAGVALVNDVTEAARAPRFGSLGANGILAAPTAAFNLATQTMASVEAQAPRTISVDASGVILGHSDLIKAQVFKLIWDAIESVR
jgi:hypothetical protein